MTDDQIDLVLKICQLQATIATHKTTQIYKHLKSLDAE